LQSLQVGLQQVAAWLLNLLLLLPLLLCWHSRQLTQQLHEAAVSHQCIRFQCMLLSAVEHGSQPCETTACLPLLLLLLLLLLVGGLSRCSCSCCCRCSRLNDRAWG
jgi:hypothetical protein